LQTTRTKTGFFLENKVSRQSFCTKFVKELGPYLREIGLSTTLGSISIEALFPELRHVSPREADVLISKLDIAERVVQDTLRTALREKGATNMVPRKSDTVLEIADLEDFTLKLKGRDTTFTAVVKGYRSVKGQTVTLEDVAHQVMKAFNGTYPDYILLVLAKSPVDGLITNMVRFGESVGNRNLVVLVDPANLARLLRVRQVI